MLFIDTIYSSIILPLIAHRLINPCFEELFLKTHLVMFPYRSRVAERKKPYLDNLTLVVFLEEEMLRHFIKSTVRCDTWCCRGVIFPGKRHRRAVSSPLKPYHSSWCFPWDRTINLITNTFTITSVPQHLHNILQAGV